MMKQKTEVRSQKSAVVAAIVLLFLSSMAVAAQTKEAVKTSALPVAVQPETVPAVKTEDQVRILKLQVSQYKKLLEMRQLEARYKALQEAIAVDQRELEQAVRDAAKNAGADLEKFQLDLDELRFVPRPPQPKSPEVKKP